MLKTLTIVLLLIVICVLLVGGQTIPLDPEKLGAMVIGFSIGILAVLTAIAVFED